MDTEKFGNLLLNYDFTKLDDSNLTAEKFMKLNPSERFLYRMKWNKEGLLREINGEEDAKEYFKNKNDAYEKPLTRTMIKVYITERDVYYDKFESAIDIISEGFKITEGEIKKALKTKEKRAGIFKFEKVKEILVGNDYIEVN